MYGHPLRPSAATPEPALARWTRGATAVCGLTEKAFFQIGGNYTRWVDVVQSLTPPEEISDSDQQAIILNVTAGSLAVLAVLLPLLLWYPKFRFRSEVA